MQLRDYQSDLIAETRALMQNGCRSILITSPTGSGKTVLTAHMLQTAAQKSLASWFVVHRRELVKQSTRSFSEVGVRHGIIAAGFSPDSSPFVQIGSIQTLANRYSRYRPPKLLIWDECHHVAAGTWSRLFAAFPDSFHIGLTATPERLDGTGLGKWFQKMVHGPSVRDLIERGYLSSYRLFAPSKLNLENLHTRMGDFVKSELSDLVDRPSITGNAILEYQKRAAGKRAIVFGVSIEHSQHVVAQARAAGIPAEHVDGDTPSEIRDAAIDRFIRGETMWLSNVDLFGEGFDVPSAKCLIDLAPTQSLSRSMQRWGRVLRPDGTDAVILDHAGNCRMHGLPDEEREWSLAGRGRSRKGVSRETASVKVCPQCFAAQFSGNPDCFNCGLHFELKARQVEQVEGDLVEIDPEQIRLARKKEQKEASSLEDLIALGRARGYKRPHLWAKHVFNARQSRKLRGDFHG